MNLCVICMYLSSKLHNISQKEAGFVVTEVIITNYTIFSSIILFISHHISHIYYFRLESIHRKSSLLVLGNMQDCLEGIKAGLTSLCPSLLFL